jgi:hypothetical protein
MSLSNVGLSSGYMALETRRLFPSRVNIFIKKYTVNINIGPFFVSLF